jgi:hypothetical protein
MNLKKTERTPFGKHRGLRFFLEKTTDFTDYTDFD